MIGLDGTSRRAEMQTWKDFQRQLRCRWDVHDVVSKWIPVHKLHSSWITFRSAFTSFHRMNPRRERTAGSGEQRERAGPKTGPRLEMLQRW